MKKTMNFKGRFRVIDVPEGINNELVDSLNQGITDYTNAEERMAELEPILPELEKRMRSMEIYLNSHQDMHPEVKAEVEATYNTMLSRWDTVREEYEAVKEQRDIAEEKVITYSELCGVKVKPSLTDKVLHYGGIAFRTIKDLLE